MSEAIKLQRHGFIGHLGPENSGDLFQILSNWIYFER